MIPENELRDKRSTYYEGEIWIHGDPGQTDVVPVDESELHYIGADCPCGPVLPDAHTRIHRIGSVALRSARATLK